MRGFQHSNTTRPAGAAAGASSSPPPHSHFSLRFLPAAFKALHVLHLMPILSRDGCIRLFQSRSARMESLGRKKKKGPRGPRRPGRQEKPTRAEKHKKKLHDLSRKLPVATLCCSCKGKHENGDKVNHLLDHHHPDELECLRKQYHEQPTEESRKAFLKRHLRPEGALLGEHVAKFEVRGHYLCWDGAKKLFGVSKNLLSCVANTPTCLKYGESSNVELQQGCPLCCTSSTNTS